MAEAKEKGAVGLAILIGIGVAIGAYLWKGPDAGKKTAAPVKQTAPKVEPKKPEPKPEAKPAPPKPEITRDFSKTDYRILLKRFQAWQCEKNRSPITPDTEIYYVFQELLRRPEVRWDQKSTSMQEAPQSDSYGKRRGRR